MGNRKSAALGIPLGTAANKLRKAIMFDLVKQLGKQNCFRCGKPIEDVSQFSIEHKTSWRFACDPIESFFDLENIAFSHHSCNSSSGNRNRIYANLSERRKAAYKRQLPNKLKFKKAWRQRKREAGLPYS